MRRFALVKTIRFSGGEGAEEAYDVQMEEAAARATVALTRAKELCVILGPLDMLGLIGAATVIESLMYGVGRRRLAHGR